jgi:hypothetical protein
VTSVTGKVPAVIVTGTKVKGSVSVTVRNDTDADFSGPVTVSVLASTDAVADNEDASIATSSKTLKLKAGQTRVVKLKLSSLPTLADGTYTLLGTAAANNLTSSAAGPTTAVQAPFVRLATVSGAPVLPSKRVVLGRPATLTFRLANEGNVATTAAPATYTLIVSFDAVEPGNVYQTTATGRLNIRPGRDGLQKVRVTFPAGAFAAGNYTVQAKLQAELNQTNDTILTATNITAL